jgi:2-keto-4-pentenoate hydratase
MIGEWQSPKLMKNLDNTKVSLSCKGQTLAQGKGSNASQSQVNALLWLVNHMIDQGYKIQKGQILITGNLIKMVPAKPCVYLADYGQMGKLALTVTD